MTEILFPGDAAKARQGQRAPPLHPKHGKPRSLILAFAAAGFLLSAMDHSILHRRITLILQGILTVGALLAAYEGQWLTLATTLAIIGLTFLPVMLERRFKVFIPPEFECMATIFVFASLFLGEVRGYYERFWWWDISLHAASGVLLGIVGFLLVYILNESEEINVHLTPGFVALFAFMFAVTMGTLWEIFEFAMDQLGGFNMQKPMLGDPSGLTDTMWDLIVDTAGALLIALLGLGYLRNWGSSSFLERWIQAFIRGNPSLFERKDERGGGRDKVMQPATPKPDPIV